MNDAPSGPALLTAAEVAPLLRIPRNTLYILVRRGDAPVAPVRVGRSYRWRRAEVEAWLRGEPTS